MQQHPTTRKMKFANLYLHKHVNENRLYVFLKLAAKFFDFIHLQFTKFIIIHLQLKKYCFFFRFLLKNLALRRYPLEVILQNFHRMS